MPSPLPFSFGLSYVSHMFLRWRNARNSPKPYDLNEFPSFESFGWIGEAYSYRALLDILVRSKKILSLWIIGLCSQLFHRATRRPPKHAKTITASTKRPTQNLPPSPGKSLLALYFCLYGLFVCGTCFVWLILLLLGLFTAQSPFHETKSSEEGQILRPLVVEVRCTRQSPPMRGRI